MMNTKSKKNVIFVLIVIYIFSFQSTVSADILNDYSQDNKPFLKDDEPIRKKSIGSSNVVANRISSKKITYTVNTSFYPRPDNVSIKVWKCTYSGRTGKWSPQGGAQKFTYGRVSKITRFGTFSVASRKKYKIKVSVTEIRNGKSNSRVLYSSAV